MPDRRTRFWSTTSTVSHADGDRHVCPGRNSDGEPERRAFIETIEAADSRHISVATFVESSIIIEARHGAEGQRDLDRFMNRGGIELVAVDSNRDKSRAELSAVSAKDVIGRLSITVTASPMRWRSSLANLSSAREMIHTHGSYISDTVHLSKAAGPGRPEAICARFP